MGNVKVRCYQRNRKIGDKDSLLYYYLRQKADSTQIFATTRNAPNNVVFELWNFKNRNIMKITKFPLTSFSEVLRFQ